MTPPVSGLLARATLGLVVLLAAGCGGGGSSGPEAPPAAPTVTLSAAPPDITAGQATTLTWSSRVRISANVTGDFGNVTDLGFGAGLRG